jgi:hypothetical protein
MLQADMDSFVSREKEFFAGRGTLPFVTDTVIRLRDTQLASSKTRADRFAAWEACWMALHQNEAVCLQRFAAGLIPVEDAMEARYARLAAERPLHDAWRTSRPSHPAVPFWLGDAILGGTPLSDKDLMRNEVERMQASPEERAKAILVCAQNDWDARRQEFRKGRGFQWFLLDAARRRIDAGLALATRPAERLDCLKQYRQDLEDIEAVNQRRYDEKLIQIQDLMDAKYARLEAEIRLAEAERAK